MAVTFDLFPGNTTKMVEVAAEDDRFGMVIAGVTAIDRIEKDHQILDPEITVHELGSAAIATELAANSDH